MVLEAEARRLAGATGIEERNEFKPSGTSQTSVNSIALVYFATSARLTLGTKKNVLSLPRP